LPSFPSPPSLWRMQGEHTPACVAGSRVAGFRVIELEPDDEPDQLWDCSARSSAMGKAMMASAWRCVRSCRSLAAAGVPGDGGGVGGQLEPPGNVRAVLDDCPAEAVAGRGHPGVHAKGVRKRRPFGGSAPNCALYLGGATPSVAVAFTKGSRRLTFEIRPLGMESGSGRHHSQRVARPPIGQTPDGWHGVTIAACDT
jgi:hypothetical protein